MLRFVSRVSLNYSKLYRNNGNIGGVLLASRWNHRTSQKYGQHQGIEGSFSPSKIESWIGTLEPHERQILIELLQKHNQIIPETTPISLVTTKQLLHVGFTYSLPFIGFGFLDNFIMIIAGDYIDLTLGTVLGISTMAAAALGNAISDVAGIGSAWYVESLTSKLGVPQPDLNPQQMSQKATRWAVNLGRAAGVTIGCLLGMVPLLFLPTSEDKDKHKD